jgi:hypothetical protein
MGNKELRVQDALESCSVFNDERRTIYLQELLFLEFTKESGHCLASLDHLRISSCVSVSVLTSPFRHGPRKDPAGSGLAVTYRMGESNGSHFCDCRVIVSPNCCATRNHFAMLAEEVQEFLTGNKVVWVGSITSMVSS